MLDADLANTTVEPPAVKHPPWPGTLPQSAFVGTWISESGKDDDLDAFSLKRDGTWWRAAFSGSVDNPTKVLHRVEFQGKWKLLKHETTFGLQFGNPIRHPGGGETLPPSVTFTAVFRDRIVAQPFFKSIVMQRIFNRATEDQASQLETLLADDRK